MNKSVKIIMALAIGIIFPILVLFIALVFYPDSSYKTSSDAYPIYPDTSICYDYGYENARSKACSETLISNYEEKLASFEQGRDKKVIDRVQVALVSAILGFIIAMLAIKFSPITVGMSGGSAVLVLFASYYSSTANAAMGSFATLLFTICFVSLIIMLFFVEKVLPKPTAANPPQQINQ